MSKATEIDPKRKPLSTAVLKNLPEEKQAEIADWCAKANDKDASGRPIPLSGGLAYAQQKLAEQGISSSGRMLSQFFSWWKLQQDLQAAFDTEDQVMAETGDAQRAREAGERMLQKIGLARRDPELLVAAAKISDSRRGLDLKSRDLSLVERRVAILEANAARAKDALNKVVKKGGISPETLEKIREAAGLL